MLESVKRNINPYAPVLLSALNRLTIEFNTQEGYNYGVILYNAAGHLVQQFTQLKTGRVIFELDNQTSGMYYDQVLESGKSIYSGKVLME